LPRFFTLSGSLERFLVSISHFCIVSGFILPLATSTANSLIWAFERKGIDITT